MSGDNADYLRRWAADIRTSNGKSVDADRLDSIAADIDALKQALVAMLQFSATKVAEGMVDVAPELEPVRAYLRRH